DEPQVGFVDQGGGLERLPGRLLGHPLCGQLTQLLVDERQQLLGGVRVALLDGAQDARDLTHKVKHNRRGCDRPASGQELTGGGRGPGREDPARGQLPVPLLASDALEVRKALLTFSTRRTSPASPDTSRKVKCSRSV